MCNSVIDNHTYTEIPLDWLEDDSYTVSYALTSNPETEGWVSFHDYIPDYSIVLRNQTLLQFYQGQLYQHNIAVAGLYFGLVYNSSITPVVVSNFRTVDAIYPFLIKAINWNTDIEDSATRKLQETWSTISLHNSFQGTRQIPIVIYDTECTLLEQYGKFNAKRTKNRWYFNYAFNEKDLTNQRTWLELRDKFLVINGEDKSCTWDELYRTRLFDDFVIVRLVYENANFRKLVHYDLSMDLLVSTQ